MTYSDNFAIINIEVKLLRYPNGRSMDMDIKNNVAIGNGRVKETYADRKQEKTVPQQSMAEPQESDAASLKLSAQALDNLDKAVRAASESGSTSISAERADEMISASNRRILEQADDALLAQANQIAETVAGLLAS